MAIIGSAVIPHPPALLPGVTGLPIAEIEVVRAAAESAIGWTCQLDADLVIAIAGGTSVRTWTPARSPAAGFVAACTTTDTVPLGLDVVTALAPAGTPILLKSVNCDIASPDAARFGVELAAAAPRVALIAVGDGSARRGPKAPGYFDDRCAAFDAEVEQALRNGDADAFSRLDAELAAELLVAGRAAWQVMAGAVCGATVSAELDYTGDPFGVWYAVARWLIAPTGRT